MLPNNLFSFPRVEQVFKFMSSCSNSCFAALFINPTMPTFMAVAVEEAETEAAAALVTSSLQVFAATLNNYICELVWP